MALRVMLLDMFELRGILEGRNVPVQVAHPLVEMRISAANVGEIALEVLDVYRVKADDCGEETDVGFCDRGAEVVR